MKAATRAETDAVLLMDRIETHSPEETRQWAQEWVQSLPKGSVVALHGELGAGKTTFTQGLALGLFGSEESVTSPTFGYMHLLEHGDRILAHFDLYRLKDPEEFHLMGWDEWFDQADLTVIEWPERILDYLPDQTIHLQLEHSNGKDSNVRVISLQ